MHEIPAPALVRQGPRVLGRDESKKGRLLIFGAEEAREAAGRSSGRGSEISERGECACTYARERECERSDSRSKKFNLTYVKWGTNAGWLVAFASSKIR